MKIKQFRQPLRTLPHLPQTTTRVIHDAQHGNCDGAIMTKPLLLPAIGAFLCSLVACTAAQATRVQPTPADELSAAIATSDLPRALAALCAAYAAGGTPCAESVYLTLLEPTDVMSHIDSLQNIYMTPMPSKGNGLAYWDNWSQILSGGQGSVRARFADDDDARHVANMLAVTVLAHELGHHVAARFGCELPGPANELRADELSLPLLVGLLDAGLAPLHQRMRTVADELIASVAPAARIVVPNDVDVRGWAAAQPELPQQIAAYVTLHLSRQRRLLEQIEPYVPVVQRLCLGPFAKFIAARTVVPGRVSTLAVLPSLGNDKVAITREGHVFAISWPRTPDQPIGIRRIDGPAAPLAAVLAGRAIYIRAFAAFSDDRFAVSDGSAVWLVQRDSTGQIKVLPQGECHDVQLAFDNDGNLFTAETSDFAWTAGPIGAKAIWHVNLDDHAGWADGPLASARAAPERLAIANGRAVFVDYRRDAIRSVGVADVVTHAGKLAGQSDGDAQTAEVFAPSIAALGVLADGRIAVVQSDRGRGRTLVRAIEAK